MPFDFRNGQDDCAPMCASGARGRVSAGGDGVGRKGCGAKVPEAALPTRGHKGMRQQSNYHAGLNAEHLVARYYADRGARTLQSRWRGPGGEIDLILAEGDTIVFVEVKKSRTHAQAAQRVTGRQVARILSSAEAYLGTCPDGLLTDARFDVALVDARGEIDLIPNASMAA